MSEWSTERIARCFRDEVLARFEAENAQWRAEDAASTEQAKRERPEPSDVRRVAGALAELRCLANQLPRIGALEMG